MSITPEQMEEYRILGERTADHDGDCACDDCARFDAAAAIVNAETEPRQPVLELPSRDIIVPDVDKFIEELGDKPLISFDEWREKLLAADLGETELSEYRDLAVQTSSHETYCRCDACLHFDDLMRKVNALHLARPDLRAYFASHVRKVERTGTDEETEQ